MGYGGAVARWRGGAVVRTSDSQSTRPGFEKPLVAVSKLELFRSLRVASVKGTNEYLAIDSEDM